MTCVVKKTPEKYIGNGSWNEESNATNSSLRTKGSLAAAAAARSTQSSTTSLPSASSPEATPRTRRRLTTSVGDAGTLPRALTGDRSSMAICGGGRSCGRVHASRCVCQRVEFATAASHPPITRTRSRRRHGCGMRRLRLWGGCNVRCRATPGDAIGRGNGIRTFPPYSLRRPGRLVI